MITRIVKLTFAPEKLKDFLIVFEESKNLIRSFEGCLYLELFQDAYQQNVLFTHSKWQSLEALNKYRSSPLFQETWGKTKIYFIAKPEAWSLNSIDEIK